MADKAKEEVVVEKTAKKTRKRTPAVEVSNDAEVQETATETVEAPAKPEREVSLKEQNPEKCLEYFKWHN
jgi:hypothetical protein